MSVHHEVDHVAHDLVDEAPPTEIRVPGLDLVVLPAEQLRFPELVCDEPSKPSSTRFVGDLIADAASCA
jgi:hypothetical protein